MIVDARMVHRARTELFETGSVSEPMTRAVRPEILASWRRSAAFGAKPDVITLPYHEDNGVGERLLDAAAPVLRALADSLAGLHAGVLLADREANIVERWVADAAILGELDRICSDAGFSAPEDRVGTNGIGTVAELGRAQLIIGPEHFADALTSFTCVGAPIRNPTTRRLEGIVTLSCRADAGNALLTPLMVSTASDIEHRLLQAVTVDERRMLDAYLGAKRRHHLVAAVGRDLLIAGARATHVLEDLVERDVLWELVSDLLAGAGPMVRTVAAGSTREVGLTLTPVLDDGRLVGAIVDIDDSHDVEVQRHRGATPTRAIDLPGESVTWLAAIARGDPLRRVARAARHHRRAGCRQVDPRPCRGRLPPDDDAAGRARLSRPRGRGSAAAGHRGRAGPPRRVAVGGDGAGAGVVAPTRAVASVVGGDAVDGRP